MSYYFAKNCLFVEILAVKMSLETLKEKHPNRVDLIQNMTRCLENLNHANEYFEEMKIQLSALQQNNLDLTKLYIEQKNKIEELEKKNSELIALI